MTIEDIDHLLANSEIDSATFFIDSSIRDMSWNPNPNSFTLSFTEPIKNVCGFEILDATIPVTMWIIDTYNNILAYSHVFYNTGTNANDFKRYYKEIKNLEFFSNVFNAKDNANIFFCLDETNFETMKNYETQNITFSTNLVFYRKQFDNLTFIRRSSLKTKAEKDAMNGTPFITLDNGNDKLYIIGTNSELVNYINIYEQGLNNWLDIQIFDESSLFVYQYKYLQKSTVEAFLTIQKQDLNSIPWDFYIANIYLEIENGNYQGLEFYQFMSTFLNDNHQLQSLNFFDPSNVYVTQINKYGDITKQFRLRFEHLSTHNIGNNIFVDLKKSTSRDVFGFVYDTPGYTYLDEYIFMSVPDPNEVMLQYLDPGGILNLQGVRYILLRIPEIESHLLKSLAYGKCTPGIGMFKLASVNDVTQLRFDFTNFQKKPFHPIGKLSKITLNFTLDNGELYNFKGVDYSILIMIKFYVPKTVQRLGRSILNPNYDPDFVKYSTREMKQIDIKEYTESEILKEQNKWANNSL